MEMKNRHPHKTAAAEEEKVSTKLTLSCGASVINRDPFSALRNKNLNEEEEVPVGISLRLPLYKDPLTIRKKLTKSDVGQLCQLLFKKELVEAQILVFWDANRIAEANTLLGTQFDICDIDTEGSRHTLTFKRWSSSNSYVINNNWTKEFVERRVLRKGDEIGLPKENFSHLLIETNPRVPPLSLASQNLILVYNEISSNTQESAINAPHQTFNNSTTSNNSWNKLSDPHTTFKRQQ